MKYTTDTGFYTPAPKDEGVRARDSASLIRNRVDETQLFLQQVPDFEEWLLNKKRRFISTTSER